MAIDPVKAWAERAELQRAIDRDPHKIIGGWSYWHQMRRELEGLEAEMLAAGIPLSPPERCGETAELDLGGAG